MNDDSEGIALVLAFVIFVGIVVFGITLVFAL